MPSRRTRPRYWPGSRWALRISSAVNRKRFYRGTPMALNRRIFLKNSALAMVGVGAAPLWLQRAVYAAETPAQRKKILVAIFQRGAADGLNIVVPHGEKRYYELRPTLGIPQTSVIDLDGLFGLNPALAPLKPIWDQ